MLGSSILGCQGLASRPDSGVYPRVVASLDRAELTSSRRPPSRGSGPASGPILTPSKTRASCRGSFTSTRTARAPPRPARASGSLPSAAAPGPIRPSHRGSRGSSSSSGDGGDGGGGGDDGDLSAGRSAEPMIGPERWRGRSLRSGSPREPSEAGRAGRGGARHREGRGRSRRGRCAGGREGELGAW